MIGFVFLAAAVKASSSLVRFRRLRTCVSGTTRQCFGKGASKFIITKAPKEA